MIPLRRGSRRGMTLVELLVVLALLAAVAGSAVALTDSTDRRARFVDTSNRLAAVRDGVLGPDVVGPSGLLTGGYLQDVGWLPAAGEDLLRTPTGVSARAYDTTWRTWFGWAGPYVVSPPMRRTDAAPALYDGWGRNFTGWPGGTPWTLPVVSGDLAVRSLGADGKADTGAEMDAYDRDAPLAAQPLLPETEWVTDLRSWTLTIVNKTGAAIGFATPVRWRVIVPRWDKADPLGHWPASAAARNTWEHYGAVPFTTPSIPVDGSYSTQFGAGAARRVPNGRRTIFLVDDATGAPLVNDGTGARTVFTEIELSRKLAPREIRVEVR